MPAFTPTDMRAMQFATQVQNVLANSTNMVTPTKDVQSITANYDFKTQTVTYNFTYTDGSTDATPAATK